MRSRPASRRSRPAVERLEARDLPAITINLIAEYALPTAASGPVDVALGPDGALWITESADSRLQASKRDSGPSSGPGWCPGATAHGRSPQCVVESLEGRMCRPAPSLLLRGESRRVGEGPELNDGVGDAAGPLHIPVFVAVDEPGAGCVRRGPEGHEAGMVVGKDQPEKLLGSVSQIVPEYSRIKYRISSSSTRSRSAAPGSDERWLPDQAGQLVQRLLAATGARPPPRPMENFPGVVHADHRGVQAIVRLSKRIVEHRVLWPYAWPRGETQGLLLDVAEIWELFVLATSRRVFTDLTLSHGTWDSGEEVALLTSEMDGGGLGNLWPDVLVQDWDKVVGILDAK